MTFLSRLLALSCLPLLIGPGCARSPVHDARSTAFPLAYLSCGYASLEAGQGRGYLLHREGRVERWSGRAFGDALEPAGRVDSAEVRSAWAAWQDAGFLARREQAVGVSAAYLSATTEARTHRISWPIGPGAPAPDTVLAGLLARCEQVARSAR